jgi:3-oxoacyl-[acyl-carrier-protein] synthase II
MSRREAVITGMGLITALGGTVEENWANVEALRTGIAHFPQDGLPPSFQYAGKVARCEAPEHIPPKLQGEMRFLNRGALLGLVSACEAVWQSGAKLPDISLGRRALYIASGDFTKVGCEFMHPATREASDAEGDGVDCRKLNDAALHRVNPFFLLESISNNLFSFLSALLEFRGPSTSLASLSPYGAQALELACRSIEGGRADVALAVGYGNWITGVPVYELEGLGLLSKCAAGPGSFRPFDRFRDGFIPGEGGAALLLEAAEVAAQRGATVLGRVRGSANCIEPSPGHGISVPPRVNRRSICMALEDAGLGLGDMAFISAHGSATPKGDRSELRSILDVAQAHGADVPVCGMKPYTGHMGAASDLAEIVLGICALQRHVVPATLHFGRADKEFAGVNIFPHHRRCEERAFLSLSYGMGGQSSSIVVTTP